MIIKRLELQGVGPLEDDSFDFHPSGITTLLGPNESGKTTLCTAIVAVLHGVDKGIDLHRSWSGGEDFTGSLYIEIDDMDYQIDRNFETDRVLLTKIEASGEEILFEGDANPRGRTEEPKLYRRLIENELGLPTVSVLRNSSFVDQLDLYVEIDEELRRQISGAGQGDYKRASTYLRDRYYTLTSSPLPGDRKRAKDRTIEIMQCEIEDLEADLEGSIVKREDASISLEEHSEIDEEVEKCQKEFEEANKKRLALDHYDTLIEKFDSFNQQKELHEKTKENIDRLVNEIENSTQELQKDRYEPFRNLSEDELKSLRKYVQSDAESTWKKLQDHHAEEAKLRQELEDRRFQAFTNTTEDTGDNLKSLQYNRAELFIVQKNLESISPEGEKPSRRLTWAVPLLLALMGVLIGGFLGYQLIPAVTDAIEPITGALLMGASCALFAGLTGLFVILLVAFTRKTPERKQIEAEAKQKDTKAEIDRLEESLESVLSASDDEVSLDVLIDRWSKWEDLQDQLHNVDRNIEILQAREAVQLRDDPTIAGILDNLGVAVIEERLSEFYELKSGIQVASETLEGLTTSEEVKVADPEKLESNLQEALLHISAIEKEYPTFKTLKEDDVARRQKMQEVNVVVSSRENELEEKKQNLIQINQDLAVHHAISLRDPSSIQEEIEEKTERLNRLLLRSSALQTATEVLREAINEYEQDHLHRLSEATSQYFSTFTNERYAKIEISAGEEITVFPQDGEPFDASLLSAGAQDQLYLAIRLAVTDLLSSEVNLPFMFDDSFVNFDDQRLAAANEVLSQISEDRQVILLSHDQRYEAFGDHRIEM